MEICYETAAGVECSTLDATADSYISELAPNGNYGTSDELFIGFYQETELKKHGLVRFNLPTNPEPASIGDYVSGELKNYLADNDLTHTHGRPYHPMTQGKIERYHRSMKNILQLDNYYSPDDLKAQIADFVEYYNNERYHESLNNVTPADVYTGRNVRIIQERQRIKERTMKLRKQNYKKQLAENKLWLNFQLQMSELSEDGHFPDIKQTESPSPIYQTLSDNKNTFQKISGHVTMGYLTPARYCILTSVQIASAPFYRTSIFPVSNFDCSYETK